ncbi:diacylglycerol/lipid kinase family protein [Demequina flava]|uniref:diacylglycerol/lipid kinase family protein n=1 Tax=Demequina flava TaxID=1095025 RepID=UPI0009E4F246|nr:diacylglycerol kinase family protein [Demequina flava]
MLRIGLAANPTADAGKGKQAAFTTRRALERGGASVTDLSGHSWKETLTAAGDASGHIDALVVVGGDGMVHLGLQVCASTGLPMGIVAAGSGNDFATALGLPIRDPETAVAQILASVGSPREVDLGLVTTGDGVERWYGGVLSAGIDAAVAERGRRMKIPRGEFKYKVAVALELPGYAPYGVHVAARRADSKVVDTDSEWTLIAVSNSGVLGGGIPMSPGSALSDGDLELVRAEPLTRRGIVKIFPRLLKGTHVNDARVHITPVSQVILRPGSTGAAAPVASADGEAVGHLPLTVTSAPGALRLLGPPAH